MAVLIDRPVEQVDWGARPKGHDACQCATACLGRSCAGMRGEGESRVFPLGMCLAASRRERAMAQLSPRLMVTFARLIQTCVPNFPGMRAARAVRRETA